MNPFGSLDQSKKEIRLLRLDLSNTPDKRAHRLLSNVSLLNTNRKYVALSYPWGDTQDSTRLIVEGAPLQVTVNFTNALDEAIQFWRSAYATRDEEMCLWTDQICVNQRDHAEKSQQVGMMGDIFRQAVAVLVWLPVSTQFRGSFSTWEDWSKWHKTQLETGQMTRNDEMLYSRTSVTSRTSEEYPVLSFQDRHDRDLMLAWSNVHGILESSWWSRAWALQEFLGPNKAIFLMQGLAVPWDELQNLLARFYSQRKDYSKLLKDKEEILSQQEFQTPSNDESPGCFDQCCGGGGQAAKSTDVISSEQTSRKRQLAHLQSHHDQSKQTDELWPVVNYVLGSRAKRMKEGPEKYILLSELLKHGADCKSAEVRDKIYAFLGLATPSYGITPDYDRPPNAVFMETAQAIINQERRLDILAVARENRKPKEGSESLPSWVPDWSDSHRAKIDYKKFLKDVKYPVTSCRASQDTKAEVKFQNRFLEITGIRADRLSRKVEDPPYRPYKSFQTQDRRDVCTVNSAKEGDEIWIFFGANEVFTLRNLGSYYTILGHAMVYEAGKSSPIMDGALIEFISSGKGNIRKETIQIT